MRSIVPIALPLSALSTSVATDVDVFLFVAIDCAIERGWLVFDADVTGRGVMRVSLVQDLGDRGIVQVGDETVLTEASIAPIEMELQSAALEAGSSVYLRVSSKPSSGSTPWWGTATLLSGSLHLMDTATPANGRISATEANPNPDVSTYQGD